MKGPDWERNTFLVTAGRLVYEIVRDLIKR